MSEHADDDLTNDTDGGDLEATVRQLELMAKKEPEAFGNRED